jgi:hypothetical protein
LPPPIRRQQSTSLEQIAMYGLIVKMTVLPGRRDDVIALLTGCSAGIRPR